MVRIQESRLRDVSFWKSITQSEWNDEDKLVRTKCPDNDNDGATHTKGINWDAYSQLGVAYQ